MPDGTARIPIKGSVKNAQKPSSKIVNAKKVRYK